MLSPYAAATGPFCSIRLSDCRVGLISRVFFQRPIDMFIHEIGVSLFRDECLGDSGFCGIVISEQIARVAEPNGDVSEPAVVTCSPDG